MRRSIVALACCVAAAAAAWAEDFTSSQVRFYPAAVQAADVQVSRFGTYIALADATEGNSVRVLDAHWELLWRTRQSAYWGGTFKESPVLQFAPDESFLVMPSYRTSYDIALVNPRTGEPLSVLNGHSFYVNLLALSPDGSSMLSAAGQELFLWRRSANTKTPGAASSSTG